MLGEEGGHLAELFFEPAAHVGSDQTAVLQGLFEVGPVTGEGGDVAAVQRDIAACQRLAVRQGRTVRVGGAAAERPVGVVDAGDVLAGVDARVVAVHDPLEPAGVGDDLAAEGHVAFEVGEPGFGFGGCGAGQLVVAVAGDEVAELLAAGDGVFGLDFGAEP